MNVKGAVAEEHLRLLLKSLKDKGAVDEYTIGGEGQPDFTVHHDGHQTTLECKNVEKGEERCEPRGAGPGDHRFQEDQEPTRRQTTPLLPKGDVRCSGGLPLQSNERMAIRVRTDVILYGASRIPRARLPP